MRYLRIPLLIFLGLLVSIIIQYSFSFAEVKYPILLTSVLFGVTGFLSTYINLSSRGNTINYFLIGFPFLFLQIYGLYINYEGLKNLSTTLIILSFLSFSTGFFFRSFKKPFSYISICLVSAATILLSFVIIPKLEFNTRINKTEYLFPDKYKLKTVEGEAFIFDRKGISVINFWDSRCLYCFKKLPYLVDLKNKLNNKEINFIQINTGDQDTFERFKKSVLNHKLMSELSVVYDEESQLTKQLKIEGVPRHLIVKDGKVLYDVTGFSNEDALFFVKTNEEFIKKHL